MTDHDRINDEAAENLVQFVALRLLREIAGLKRNDPGKHASNAGRWTVLTMPTTLIERVDEYLGVVGEAPVPPKPYDGLFAGIVDEVEARKATVGRAADRPRRPRAASERALGGSGRTLDDAEMSAHDQATIDRAFEIADAAMIVAATCYGVPNEDGSYGMADSDGQEVCTVAEAGEEMREAVEWLTARGLATLTRDAHGDVLTLARP